MRLSLRHAVKRMTEEKASPDWLLVSDIDDTLAGDDEGIAAFSRHRVRLVLNSSRPLASVRKTMSAFPAALRIDGVITGLGTEILLDGIFQTEWTARFTGWDRGPVDEIMARAGMPRHPDEMQTPFKASFAVPRDRRNELHALVRAAVPDSRIILSGDSDFDVIPALGGKDHATLWVAGKLGIDPARLIVAGDSGNDLAMFQAAGKAIAVGNARAELLDRADPATTYFAKGKRAWGLIEGLHHWGALA